MKTATTTTTTTVSKPDTVALGELAVAAGIAGQPVAACFLESTASIDCELWKHYAELVRRTLVMHVYSQRDVDRLRRGLVHWRLVIVHTPRLLNTVAWAVQLHSLKSLLRPTVFARGVPDSVDELPVPLLVLRTTPDESSSVNDWLQADCPAGAAVPNGIPKDGPVFHPKLMPVTVSSSLPEGRGPNRERDCRLLKALLSGAWLIGNAGKETRIPKCGRAEYELVRGLLQSPLLCSMESPVTQLAMDMVSRTNVLLELRCKPDALKGTRLLSVEGDQSARIRGHFTRQELITRREVADLGNIHSGLVLEIVKVMQTLPDGYSLFQRMGFIRQPPHAEGFKSCDSRGLVRMLRPWGVCQVRSHFDDLRKGGLISGERVKANKPWQYRLPEELGTSFMPFHTLPSAAELFSETPSQASNR